MPHPTQKRTKSSKKRRASHFALKRKTLGTCSHCQAKADSHRACPACGYYNGRPVVKDSKSKAKRKKKASKAKA